MGSRLISIDHVQLAMPPGKEEVAASFYEEILGLERREKPPALAARGGCWFSNGSVTLHLGVEEGFRPARKAHPAVDRREPGRPERRAECGRSRGTIRRRDARSPSLLRRRPIRQSHRADRGLKGSRLNPEATLAGSSTGRTPDFGSGGWRFEPSPASE